MGWLWTLSAFAMLGGAASILARRAFDQPRGTPANLAAFVITWAWLTLGVEALGTFGYLRDVALVGLSALALAIALAAWAWRGKAGVAPTPSQSPGGGVTVAATIALGLTLWVGFRLVVPSFLYPVKVVTDGPIYHLYFAARWWKEGRIFLVATPFGEVGAPYFWANGEAWFAWLMTLWGGDRLAKVGQVPFLIAAVATACAMARRLGAGPSAAMVATAWFATNDPLVLFAFEANVDVCFVAGYLLTAYFFLRYALDDDGVASLILGALAAGLGMGTKPTGIVFFPPLLALAALAVVLKPTTTRRKVGHLACLVLLPVAMFGYWPARNAWLTGNPLYPLQVEAFGRVLLPGWFGPGAMTRSPYYIPVGDWRTLVDILMVVFDPRQALFWLAAFAGAWRVGWRGLRHPRMVWIVAALAVANIALYWLAIPYRTQQRFMLQAAGLAVVPLALLFERSRWLLAAGLVLLAVHTVTPEPWPFPANEKAIPWDLNPSVQNIVPAPIAIPLDAASWHKMTDTPDARFLLRTTLLLGLASFVLARAWLKAGRGHRSTRWVVPIAGTAAVLALSGWCLGGLSNLPVPAFPDYFVGWMELNARTGAGGARIAYAGNKIPYYLMGAGLKNDVRYVNIDSHRDWLMHDYHRAADSMGLPSNWPDPFPGWDRLRPDYDGWLGNLRAERIQLLVVTRVNPSEGRHNVADREGFPIERVWADAHPETFVPIYGQDGKDPRFKIYRLRF